jgi:hypothetical protein
MFFAAVAAAMEREASKGGWFLAVRTRLRRWRGALRLADAMDDDEKSAQRRKNEAIWEALLKEIDTPLPDLLKRRPK